MTIRSVETWQTDVHSALKQYGDAKRLSAHPARAWPAVAARIEAGQTVTAAIRAVLAEAIDTLEARGIACVDLLRAFPPRPADAFTGRCVRRRCVDPVPAAQAAAG